MFLKLTFAVSFSIIYIYSVSFHNFPRLILFCNIATSFFIIILCRFFLINDIKSCKPLSKLDLPTLRKGSRVEITQRNKLKIRHSLAFEPRSLACRADIYIYI